MDSVQNSELVNAIALPVSFSEIINLFLVEGCVTMSRPALNRTHGSDGDGCEQPPIAFETPH